MSQAEQRSMLPSRSAASTTNQWSRRDRPKPPFCNLRLLRSLRSAAPFQYSELKFMPRSTATARYFEICSAGILEIFASAASIYTHCTRQPRVAIGNTDLYCPALTPETQGSLWRPLQRAWIVGSDGHSFSPTNAGV